MVHDVPRSTYYGVYISQLIRFARAFSLVEHFRINPHESMEQGRLQTRDSWICSQTVVIVVVPWNMVDMLLCADWRSDYDHWVVQDEKLVHDEQQQQVVSLVQ